MYMVIFTVKLNKFSLKIRTDRGKYQPKIVKNCPGKNAAPVFCYKDQVNVHSKNTMPSRA